MMLTTMDVAAMPSTKRLKIVLQMAASLLSGDVGRRLVVDRVPLRLRSPPTGVAAA